MKGILFLCVANSARSQMAEGLARAVLPPGVKVWSAGSRPTSVRPEAIAVLAEIGVDISRHHSKAVGEIPAAEVDTVITLCGEEECPLFLGKATRLHWGLPDPAAVEGSEEERLNAFRNLRDELRRRLVASLAGSESRFAGHGLNINGIVFLSPKDALPFLEADAILVDLREGLERNGREFQVNNVIPMPHRRFEAEFAALPEDRPLILACCVGLESRDAARFLMAHGYTSVASLNGGMIAWEQDGMPTAIDRGEELAGGCACQLRPRKVYGRRAGC
jgi:arsenate reductase